MKEAVNTIDDLRSEGIMLHMINLNLDLSDPLGEAMFHVVMAFAQLERGMISKRTKDALAWKRGQGLPTGRRAPIGWRKEGVEKDAVLVPDEKSRARAYLIVELRDRHRLSWEVIPAELQRHGILGEQHYRRQGSAGRLTVQTAIRAYRAARAGFPLPNGARQPAFDWEPDLWRQWGVAYDGAVKVTGQADLPL
jgi:DNA invertase Pin-like site-specific DNA recombinase